jgi:hypothetical protein
MRRLRERWQLIQNRLRPSRTTGSRRSGSSASLQAGRPALSAGSPRFASPAASPVGTGLDLPRRRALARGVLNPTEGDPMSSARMSPARVLASSTICACTSSLNHVLIFDLDAPEPGPPSTSTTAPPANYLHQRLRRLCDGAPIARGGASRVIESPRDQLDNPMPAVGMPR